MSTLYLNGWQVKAKLEERRIVAENTMTGDTVQIALFNLQRVVCIGCPHLTMPLLHQLLHHGVPVVFLSGQGRWLGSLVPPVNGNAMRRLRQYESLQQVEVVLGIAKSLIDAKIHNMRRMLQRWAANRKSSKCPEHKAVCRFLQDCRRKLVGAKTLDEARGFEGAATARYFERIDAFLPPEMPFVLRTRRPPLNPVNALLSWTYSIVTAEIDSVLRTIDLDPCIGYLHALTTGRPALALDLIEPLRAPLCDALVIRLVTHHILTPNHFTASEHNGGVYLADEAKSIFFREYERTMERVFVPKNSSEATTYRKVITAMAYSVCRCLEQHGKVNPFLMA